MIIYHFFAFAWLITIPVLAHALVKLFKLSRFNLLLTDLALPLYALALVRVSQTFFENSFLPHYLTLLSIVAIIICLVLLKKQTFSLRRFTKLFWRIGFFVTLVSYLLTLVLTVILH